MWLQPTLGTCLSAVCPNSKSTAQYASGAVQACCSHHPPIHTYVCSTSIDRGTKVAALHMHTGCSHSPGTHASHIAPHNIIAAPPRCANYGPAEAAAAQGSSGSRCAHTSTWERHHTPAAKHPVGSGRERGPLGIAGLPCVLPGTTSIQHTKHTCLIKPHPTQRLDRSPVTTTVVWNMYSAAKRPSANTACLRVPATGAVALLPHLYVHTMHSRPNEAQQPVTAPWRSPAHTSLHL